ncbi:hypothetical protein AMTRI_Chr02g255210 [Amborella trichopoda]
MVFGGIPEQKKEAGGVKEAVKIIEEAAIKGSAEPTKPLEKTNQVLEKTTKGSVQKAEPLEKASQVSEKSNQVSMNPVEDDTKKSDEANGTGAVKETVKALVEAAKVSAEPIKASDESNEVSEITKGLVGTINVSDNTAKLVSDKVMDVSGETGEVSEKTTQLPNETTKVSDEAVQVSGQANETPDEKEEPKSSTNHDLDVEHEAKPGENIEVSLSSASFKEECSFLSDLKESEKKALADMKSKVEEAILKNELLKARDSQIEELGSSDDSEKTDKPEAEVPEKSAEEKEKAEEPEKEDPENSHDEEEKPKKPKIEAPEKSLTDGEKDEKPEIEVPKTTPDEREKAEKPEEETPLKPQEEIKDISLWGVPLLPSKGLDNTDVVLLKFLRAREFRVNEAFEMLKNTLRWREEFKTDTILDEILGGGELDSVAYMNGTDREGHPVCYNIYGVFEDNELYQKTFGSEEKCEEFLRWRVQLMEKGIQKLSFKPGGISSLLQINDLNNSPGPSKKELRNATKKAVNLLQDNYPEFVARNIFINVPFWYYAFSALLSPFLTQRTRSKFVLARPAKVTETLLKWV